MFSVLNFTKYQFRNLVILNPRTKFENPYKTPALLDGSLQCGDEIVAINGINVKVL